MTRSGFEGIQYVPTEDGDGWLLGLCEGNFCKGGREGREAGNGRIIASKLHREGEECM